MGAARKELASLVSVTLLFVSVGQTSVIPFIETAPLQVARSCHTATLLSDGRVLVAGGFNGTSSLSSCQSYNPETGTWGSIVSMKRSRCQHTATTLADGTVLVSGGASDASAEFYNPSTKAWTLTTGMMSVRSRHTATLLQNGKVLVAGGTDNTGYTPVNYSEYYNPATKLWADSGPMGGGSQGTFGHTATALGDWVFTTGGWYGGFCRSSVQLYKYSSGTWVFTNGMTVGRAYHTATRMQNGKLLVVGSDPSSECFDFTTGQWSRTGNMGDVRYCHTATLLPDGRVLVVGGSNGSTSYYAGAKLYDPSSGTWSAVGSMSVGRMDHSATLLPNGKVLIVGGENGAGLSSSDYLYGCTVGFYPAGGSMVQVTKNYYNGSDNYGLLPCPVRDNYIFGGWWTGANGTGSLVTDNTILIQGTDHTLYAKWEAQTTSQGTPYVWLQQYGLVAGDDYEAAALSDIDGDGFVAWQEYLAGSDPTNGASLLVASIAVSNGTPAIAWTPNLGTSRTYTVIGKSTLADEVWGPTNAGSKFFRIKVQMP